MFFRLSSLELGLLLFGVVLGATLVGVVVGRRLRTHADTLREPFGVLQAALLGLVGLVLAMLSRGVVTVLLAAVFVSVLLLTTFDLDRPVRGFVRVPNTPLVSLRVSMELPPQPAPRPVRSPLTQGDESADSGGGGYSTVTVFARFRGWSTLSPRRRAMRYASNWRGMTASTAERKAGALGT